MLLDERSISDLPKTRHSRPRRRTRRLPAPAFVALSATALGCVDRLRCLFDGN